MNAQRFERGSLVTVQCLLVAALSLIGCRSGAHSHGTGIGAMAERGAGEDAQATLYADGVETHVVGDTPEADDVAPDAVDPLAGTRWRIVSVMPPNRVRPFKTADVEFRTDGHVITKIKRPDGTIETDDELYRVVGDTLVVNRPGFIVNATFILDGKRLIVDAEAFRAVMERR